MNRNVLAFDFGASSGRAIVGVYQNDELTLKEVHRFDNNPVILDESLHWDISNLVENIKIGIEKATSTYEISSIGVDTWGVDFGLLNNEGQLIESPVHYRDDRTKGSIDILKNLLSLEDLYQMTGNQIMEINTLFQLLVIKERQPEIFKEVSKFLFMPDLFNYILTGEMRAEQSIASTSQLTDPYTKNWHEKLIEKVDLPLEIFPEIVKEGNFLGQVKPEFTDQQIDVINVCEHDTASAVLSVPSNQDFLFVSCGTWSLVGTELRKPIVSEKAKSYNLTNESGNNDTTRFLKNCTGLWIIQELKRNYAEQGFSYTYDEITKLADESTEFICLIDTDASVFSTPGDMIERIKIFAKETKQQIPKTPGEFFRCVYESLAFKYSYTFLEIIDSVGHEFDTVNIVGGGSRSSILCQMVSDASGMKVSAGPVEATAIGNIIQQLIALGEIESVSEAREWIKQIEEVATYYPEKRKEWQTKFSDYQKIIQKNE